MPIGGDLHLETIGHNNVARGQVAADSVALQIGFEFRPLQIQQPQWLPLAQNAAVQQQ